MTDAPQQWPAPAPQPYGQPFPYGWTPYAPPRRRRRGLMLGCGIALALGIVAIAVAGVVGYHLYADRPLAGLPRMDGDHLVNDSFSWFNGTTTETLDLREPGVPDAVEGWYREHLTSLPGWTLTDPDSDGVEHAMTFTLSGSHKGLGRITFTGFPGGDTTQVVAFFTSG